MYLWKIRKIVYWSYLPNLVLKIIRHKYDIVVRQELYKMRPIALILSINFLLASSKTHYLKVKKTTALLGIVDKMDISCGTPSTQWQLCQISLHSKDYKRQAFLMDFRKKSSDCELNLFNHKILFITQQLLFEWSWEPKLTRKWKKHEGSFMVEKGVR